MKYILTRHSKKLNDVALFTPLNATTLDLHHEIAPHLKWRRSMSNVNEEKAAIVVTYNSQFFLFLFLLWVIRGRNWSQNPPPSTNSFRSKLLIRLPLGQNMQNTDLNIIQQPTTPNYVQQTEERVQIRSVNQAFLQFADCHHSDHEGI